MIILGIIYIIWTYYSYKLKHLFKQYYVPWVTLIPALWICTHSILILFLLIYGIGNGLHFIFHYPPFVEFLNYQIYP